MGIISTKFDNQPDHPIHLGDIALYLVMFCFSIDFGNVYINGDYTHSRLYQVLERDGSLKTLRRYDPLTGDLSKLTFVCSNNPFIVITA